MVPAAEGRKCVAVPTGWAPSSGEGTEPGRFGPEEIMVTFYHATMKKFVPQILKEGLRAKVPKNYTYQPKGVYLWTSRHNAEDMAKLFGFGCVLEVTDLSLNEVIEDSEQDNSVYFPGDIEPGSICEEQLS